MGRVRRITLNILRQIIFKMTSDSCPQLTSRQALAAPDAVVIAGQPRSSERLSANARNRKFVDSPLPRWREMDSNCRFRITN